MTTELFHNAYRALPMVYDDAGFSNYATIYTPRLLDFLHRNEWIGRNILDLGCGTGTSTQVFCERRMIVEAVDSSSAMIVHARARLENAGYDVRFVEEMIQSYTPLESNYDLVFALDLINEINSVRDLESVFQKANRALQTGKIFLFDLHTIQGLAADIGNKTEILCDKPGLFIVAQSQFDYDTFTLRRHYDVFERQLKSDFSHTEDTHMLRGYPYNTVKKMLERCGFEVPFTIDMDLNAVETSTSPSGRIFIIAKKVR